MISNEQAIWSAIEAGYAAFLLQSNDEIDISRIISEINELGFDFRFSDGDGGIEIYRHRWERYPISIEKNIERIVPFATERNHTVKPGCIFIGDSFRQKPPYKKLKTYNENRFRNPFASAYYEA